MGKSRSRSSGKCPCRLWGSAVDQPKERKKMAVKFLRKLKKSYPNLYEKAKILNDNDKYVGIVHILDIIKQGISNE